MPTDGFRAQVGLLLRVLPFVAAELCFALKGGTAINLFVRNLPRLSVDIDLVYLPVADRESSLADIRAALHRIAQALRGTLRNVVVSENANEEGTRVLVRQATVQIKIEVTPVLRGTVHAPEVLPVVPAVEEAFGYAETQVVSFADLYAGKLVAALDRQHPRDLFDVGYLLANEGIDASLFQTFLAYLISSGRPAHELIKPRFKDITQAFNREFVGMTVDPVSMDELLGTRETMVEILRQHLDDSARRFLMTFHELQPDWDALGLPAVQDLPAIRWKIRNLERLCDEQPDRYRKMLSDLNEAFEGPSQ